MIAVSANRPFHVPTGRTEASITIFAFALTSAGTVHSDDLDAMQEETSDWASWTPDRTTPEKLPDRSINWKLRIDAHNFNVPNISFVNSAEDPAGRYLLSTSLHGETALWHIWRAQRVNTWDFSSRTAFSSITPSMRYKYV